MLSRIADSLFWLSRYMERNDCLTRTIRTNYILSFDAGNTDYSLVDVVNLFGVTSNPVTMQIGTDAANALRFLVTDTKNFNASKVLITKARENARGVQDNITKEVWEQVNQLYHIVNQADLERKITGSGSLEIIETLDQNSILYYGVTDSTMPRGQGWTFMNLGKFIERAILTIDTTLSHFKKMDDEVNNPQDVLFWRNLLLSLSGYELYLKTYTHGRHNQNMIDHIIFNRDFPRSVIYSLTRTKTYLDDVIADTKMEGAEELQRLFGRLWSKVEFADPATISTKSLEEYILGLKAEILEFSRELSRIYFSYT